MRQAGLDNLKIFLTILVVSQHVAQGYGATGATWPIQTDQHLAWLGVYNSITAAFFMGAFFFISALFVPASLAKKGAKRFISDRLWRVGLPVPLFGWMVMATAWYILKDAQSPAHFYHEILPGINPVWFFGPLWFLMHLLAYGIFFAICFSLFPNIFRRELPTPNALSVLLYTLLLGGLTYAVRCFFAIDEWVLVLGIIPAEIAHMPQYFTLFLLGLYAGQGNWVETFPKKIGYLGLLIALVLSLLYGLNRAEYENAWFHVATGGSSWAAFQWAMLESFICVGYLIGLITLFIDKVTVVNRIQRFISAHAYVVYLVHFTIVMWVQHLLRFVYWNTWLEFVVATFLAFALSLLLGAGLKKLPLLKKIL